MLLDKNTVSVVCVCCNKNINRHFVAQQWLKFTSPGGPEDTWEQRGSHSHTCDSPSHVHTKHHPRTIPVANHRTKRRSRQQTAPLISLRKQQGWSNRQLCWSGRKLARHTRQQSSVCLSELHYQTCARMMACYSTPRKSSSFRWNLVARVKPRGGEIKRLKTKTPLLF